MLINFPYKMVKGRTIEGKNMSDQNYFVVQVPF